MLLPSGTFTLEINDPLVEDVNPLEPVLTLPFCVQLAVATLDNVSE
jgi:hypothetical protein